MKNRCTRDADKQWNDYGGRGVKVCDSWLTFAGFLSDMGVRPVGTTLDRIDNNGNYEPTNCRWADIKQQRRNRRDNRIVEYKGRPMTMVEACELSQLPYDTVRARIDKYGWSQERAFSQSVR